MHRRSGFADQRGVPSSNGYSDREAYVLSDAAAANPKQRAGIYFHRSPSQDPHGPPVEPEHPAGHRLEHASRGVRSSEREPAGAPTWASAPVPGSRRWYPR